jgi:hypothetical protein
MDPALTNLLEKEAIRDLAMLYSRSIDRRDYELLRSCYTADATDVHGDMHWKTIDAFIDHTRKGLVDFRYTGHHICNHLISVDGDKGEGEIYALGYHIVRDQGAGYIEWLMGLRYLDKYRKEKDGRWRFADRVCLFEWETKRPIEMPGGAWPDPAADPSYTFASRLFQRGLRA